MTTSTVDDQLEGSPPSDFGLHWRDEDPKPVKVDMRALVDKILARYSAKFAVLRELLQNADDAEAEQVFIRFQTEFFESNRTTADSSRPDLRSNIHRWTISNDGRPFNKDDWNRLETIAYGNSDERKIGAFGVGFYSVYKLTNEPTVTSDRRRMRFSWRENELCVTRSFLMSGSTSRTVIELPAHRPSPLDGSPHDIGRFLASFLLFATHVRFITVELDSYTLMRLKKSEEIIEDPLCFVNPRSNMMTVDGVQRKTVRICAEADPTGCTHCDPYAVHESSPSLICSEHKVQVWSANVVVCLNDELKTGLRNVTKKDSPLQCKVLLTYTSKDERDTMKEDPAPGCLFWELRANLERPAGYVYIGQKTSQTTGIPGHVAAPFIPTVERELIDLTSPHIKTWNEQLLYVAGCLARTVYDHEITLIKSKWPQNSKSDDLQSKGLHALQFFSFQGSTPNPLVSRSIHDEFFNSSFPFSIVSSIGIFPACDVRFYDGTCASFVHQVPMLPPSVTPGSNVIVDALNERGEVKVIAIPDITKELAGRIFEEGEMVSCLTWVHRMRTSMPEEMRVSFLAAARFSHTSGRTIQLSTICTFVDGSQSIFGQSPLPDNTLPPFTVNTGFEVGRLAELFDWQTLSVAAWLDNLLSTKSTLPSESNLTAHPSFAEQVFQIMARVWASLGEKETVEIKDRLAMQTCIPTKENGMKQPGEVYIFDAIAEAFSGMPVVELKGCMQDPLKKLLKFLGAREDIDLQILPSSINTWDNGRLMKYLIGRMSHISRDQREDELNQLRGMPIFVKEGYGGASNFKRFKANELCKPSQKLNNLGLDVLAWGIPRWDDNSDQAKLLANLGLSPKPDLASILGNVERNTDIRGNALQYILDNWDQYEEEYNNEKTIANLKIVPAEDQSGSSLMAKVSEVYIDDRCQLMGFWVVQKKYKAVAEKFNVPTHPSTTQLVSVLKKNPPNHHTAEKYFAYLSSRLCDEKACDNYPPYYRSLTNDEISDLSSWPFVPVDSRMEPPNVCFVGRPLEKSYVSLFTFVSLGLGRPFLELCGAKQVPNVDEIARTLLQNPNKFFLLVKDPIEYLRELRYIVDDCSNDMLAALKTASILPGFSHGSTMSGSDIKETISTRSLLKPAQVVIADNERDYLLFKDEELFHAPKDFEPSYKKLGCKRLGNFIIESYEPVGQKKRREIRCRQIQDHILERLHLLFQAQLHSTNEHEVFRCLQKRGVFRVKFFKNILMTKKLDFCGVVKERSCETTAGYKASYDDDHLPKSFKLWLSHPLDYFDIACCFSKLFYDAPTNHVCILLFTLLTARPSTLSQSGYRVDHLEPKSQHNSVVGRLINGPPGMNTEAQKAKSTSQMNVLVSTPRILTDLIKSVFKPSRDRKHYPIERQNLDAYIDSAINPPVISHSPHGPLSSAVSQKSDKSAKLCDGCKYDSKITFAESRNGYDIYVGEEISDLSDIKPCIDYFISRVLGPLLNVFGYHGQNVRMLYDPRGRQLAAFNWDGVIHLNLYQFKEEQFDKVDISVMLLSWYFTLAHEFTHNEIPTHDATFEYLCSQICQRFAFDLFRRPELQEALDSNVGHC